MLGLLIALLLAAGQGMVSAWLQKRLPVLIETSNKLLSLSFGSQTMSFELSSITGMDANVRLPFALGGANWVKVYLDTQATMPGFYVAPYIHDFSRLLTKLASNVPSEKEHSQQYRVNPFYVLVNRMMGLVLICGTFGLLWKCLLGRERMLENLSGLAAFLIPTVLFVIRGARRTPVEIEFSDDHVVFTFWYGSKSQIAANQIDHLESRSYLGDNLHLKNGTVLYLLTPYFRDSDRLLRRLKQH
jgi:hypothetical protein